MSSNVEGNASATAPIEEQKQPSEQTSPTLNATSALAHPSGKQVLQLDGLALLKIIKHAHENVPDIVSGTLLGFEQKGGSNRLEVTNCFPKPSKGASTRDYEISMMRCLREINCDTINIGWYRSVMLSNFATEDFLNELYKYQVNIPNSVCVVYDPFQSKDGKLVLRALRLSQNYMRLAAEGKFSSSDLKEARLTSESIFEELPIMTHNSSLVHAYLYELRSQKQLDCERTRLRIKGSTTIRRCFRDMEKCIDRYYQEQSKYGKQKQRRSNGGASRLETTLIARRIGKFADLVDDSANVQMSKMYLIDSLHNDRSAPKSQ